MGYVLAVFSGWLLGHFVTTWEIHRAVTWVWSHLPWNVAKKTPATN